MAVNMAVRSGRTLVGVALVAVLTACSSGGDTESGDSVNGSSVGVTETLPGDGDAEPTVTAAADPAESLDLSTVDCAADGIDLEAGWPYTVPDSVTVLATTNDVLRYRLVGVTTNADTTLGDVLDVSFGLYDSSEPTGSDDEVTVEFTADAGTARLDLERASTDECWLVEIDAEYVQAPPMMPPRSAGPVVDPLDELASVGNGDIITARGAYPLVVTQCDLPNLSIDAVSREGTLEITATEDPAVASVRWVYADGVEISDDGAIVLSLGPDTGSFVANGTSPDGPETLVIDITC